MKDFGGGSEQEIRFKVFESFKQIFASAPIRLMSRTVSTWWPMSDEPTDCRATTVIGIQHLA